MKFNICVLILIFFYSSCKSPGNTGASSSLETTTTTTTSGDKETMDIDDEEDYFDNSPLFFQPGKSGFYSPRPGKNSAERLNCFRNVGRWGFQSF